MAIYGGIIGAIITIIVYCRKNKMNFLDVLDYLAPFLPLAQSITLEMWPVEKRAQSMALFGMVVVIAPIIGPVLGGWITSNWSWPFIYFINIPIGIACVYFAKELIEDPPYAQKQANVKMDVIGFYMLIGWLLACKLFLIKEMTPIGLVQLGFVG